MLKRRTPGRLALVAAALLAAVVAAPAATISTAPASAQAAADVNPLAGGPWGVYTGAADGVYPAWQAATGITKTRLARSALRPRVRWFGSWIPEDKIESRVADYIVQTQAGNPDVLVQMAVFRLWPQGESHKDDPLTAADLAAYRRWVDNAAAAIGSARVALILEPDLAVALKGWRPAVRLELARYAAQTFSALPNTTVYLDGSDGDWLKVDAAVEMLKAAGVAYTRGFALGATHYASKRSNIAYGQELVDALAAAGVPERHFVIDTADNGRPFTWKQFYDAHPKGDFDNPPACRKRSQRRCVTLGVPPTWDVTADRWKISAGLLPTAEKYLDAFLWFGRPWLYRQATPFLESRTVRIGRTTPYSSVPFS